MSKLIDDLKSDHAKLAKVLTEVKAKGTSKTGLELLNVSKSALLSHLKKEDSMLYPELHKAAKNDPRIKSIIDTFATDMDKISKSAIDFFNKWEKGGDGIEFAKDIGNLIAVLQSRIRREETSLYPEYDKIFDKKSAA